jgi:hypothetical protein
MDKLKDHLYIPNNTDDLVNTLHENPITGDVCYLFGWKDHTPETCIPVHGSMTTAENHEDAGKVLIVPEYTYDDDIDYNVRNGQLVPTHESQVPNTFTTIPDYAKQETDSKITTPNSSWTVENDGFVFLYGMHGTGQAHIFTINGRWVQVSSAILNANTTSSGIYAVKKGDVVAVGDATTVNCLFIPPKTVWATTDATEFGKFVIGQPDYAKQETKNRITDNNGTWTAEYDGYVNVYIQATANAAQAYTNLYLYINGKCIAQEHSSVMGLSEHCILRATEPISKGDVVMCFVDNVGTTGTTVKLLSIFCHYVPPLAVPPIFITNADLEIAKKLNVNDDYKVAASSLTYQLDKRVTNIENKGNFLDSFATRSLLPSNAASFKAVNINDYANIQSDETHGGETTQYIVTDINAGIITWKLGLIFSTDVTGKQDKVPTANEDNIAIFDDAGNVIDSEVAIDMLVKLAGNQDIAGIKNFLTNLKYKGYDVLINGSGVGKDGTTFKSGLPIAGGNGLDFNTAIHTCLYQISSSTELINNPIKTPGFLFALRGSETSNNVVQLFWSTDSGYAGVYRRSSNDQGVTWTDWNYAYTSSHKLVDTTIYIATLSDPTSLLNSLQDYVTKTASTITLIIPGGVLANCTDLPAISTNATQKIEITRTHSSTAFVRIITTTAANLEYTNVMSGIGTTPVWSTVGWQGILTTTSGNLMSIQIPDKADINTYTTHGSYRYAQTNSYPTGTLPSSPALKYSIFTLRVELIGASGGSVAQTMIEYYTNNTWRRTNSYDGSKWVWGPWVHQLSSDTGIVKSIQIPSDSDLNNYVLEGHYHSAGSGTVIANLPPGSRSAGSLHVEKTGTYNTGCKQTWTDFNDSRTWIRNMGINAQNVWNPWSEVTTARTPSTNYPVSGLTGAGSAFPFEKLGNLVALSGWINTLSAAWVANTSIGTLPVELRPIRTRYVMFTTSTSKIGQLVIATTGTITPSTNLDSGTQVIVCGTSWFTL